MRARSNNGLACGSPFVPCFRNPPAYGGSPTEAPTLSDSSAIEELIQVLVENGSLNKEQAASLMEKKGQGASPLAALTES